MQRKWVMTILAGLMVWLFGASAFAELTAGQQKAAEQLIKQFSAEKFGDRQEAVAKLVAIGPDVIPLIQKTLKETTDNEVKTRCQMVLKDIEDTYGVKITEEGAATEKSLDARSLTVSKVTLNVRDETLGEVLQMLSEQSGNAPIAVQQNLADKPVTLSVKDMPYWQALDALCKVTGLIYRGQWIRNGGSLQLSPVGIAEVPNAYAGPAVLTVDQVVNTRQLRRIELQRRGRWTGEGLRYSIGCYWEDRLPVLRTEVEFTRAITPGGKNLLAGEDDEERAMRTRMGSGGGGRSQASAVLVIDEVPEGLTKLTEIAGVVHMRFGTGEKRLTLEDIGPDVKDKSVEGHGLKLAVRKVNAQRNWASLTLSLSRDGKPVDVSAYRSGAYGLFLVDAEGKRHRGYVGYRGRNVIQVNPGGNAKVNAQQLKEDEFNVSFSQLGDAAGKYTLLYVFPASELTKDYPFAFKNVPVP